MSSSRTPAAFSGQDGAGLVEVLVSVALLGIALVVMLGSVSGLLAGARLGEHRVVAQRLARNAIETDRATLAQSCVEIPTSHPNPDPSGGGYEVTHSVTCPASHEAKIKVTVVAPDGASFGLVDRLVTP